MLRVGSLSKILRYRMRLRSEIWNIKNIMSKWIMRIYEITAIEIENIIEIWEIVLIRVIELVSVKRLNKCATITGYSYYDHW